jgi:predicted nucleic acid-binding protein
MHDKAHVWFETDGNLGWATCPLVENGFVRVLTQPAYPNVVASVVEAAGYLSLTIQNNRSTYNCWTDSISLLDDRVFALSAVAGPRQLMDIYLLGLCQHNEGTFVTFDRAISTASIRNPNEHLLRVLS